MYLGPEQASNFSAPAKFLTGRSKATECKVSHYENFKNVAYKLQIFFRGKDL